MCVSEGKVWSKLFLRMKIEIVMIHICIIMSLALEMLSKFIGVDNTQGLYQFLYDETLNTMRTKLPLDICYAPPLKAYEDFEEHLGIVPEPHEDRVEGIDKPWVDGGDAIFFEVTNLDEISISGIIGMTLSTIFNYEEILNDISTILEYGICKLQKDLKNKANSKFQDGLLDDKYYIQIARVKIGSNREDPSELLIKYELMITDELALRPESSGYAKVKDRTKVGNV